MGEQEIDKLLLEIGVEDKTQGGSKKLVNDFATAVSKLNEQIAKLDVSKFETITKAMSEMSGNTRSVKDLTGAMKKQGEQVNELVKKFSELKDAREKATGGETMPLPKAQGGTAPQLDGQAEKEKLSLAERLRSVDKKLLAINEKITAEIDKQDKTQKNTLLSSLKRVAVYRAIRGLLKSITSAFKEGFSNLAQYSSEVNGTLSQLNSSFTVMKNSVAVAFLPILNAITPLVQTISMGIANLANSISYLSAKLHGNATYLKVNTDYLKEMNKQSTLLSFDTFEKLGSGEGYGSMFEETAVSEGYDTAKLTEALSILTGISGIIAVIGGAKLIGWITGGGLLKGVSSIAKALKTTSGTIGIIVAGVALLVAGISDLASSWGDVNFESWEKAVTIVTALVAGIVGAVVAVKALALSVPVALGLGAALTGGILLLGTELSKATPKNYAFGGGYDSADLFYANENGQTELIASTNSGGGAVMNMQQLESAIYSGMIKAMASNSNGGESAVYLDGNKVGTFIASNSGFRNEANRRMTGLNWR